MTLVPGRPLRGREIEVPGDPSSAAFLAVAGVLVGDGVVVERVGTNPTRARFLDVLDRHVDRFDKSDKYFLVAYRLK